mgnify:CR=1 FL=1
MKIIVIGCPGSGKSTFSVKLHEITGIPLFHLDMMYWNADKTTVDKTTFLKRLTAVLESDEWIIDGNYASTMDLRMQASDTVVFLDYPVEVCLDGIEKRKGRPHRDMPWTEDEYDAEFIEFIKNYNTENKPRVVKLLEKYSDKNVFIFKNRDESEEFLSDIKNKFTVLKE